jgi:hypothetical protein
MIKISHDGVDYYCDTADDAVSLGAKLRGIPHSGPKKPPHSEQSTTGSRWTVTRFQSFITQLRDRQRRFLSLVINSPDGLTDSSLRQSLGVNTNKGFGPILTGISRRAKKAGVSLQDILTSEKVQLSANERVTEFKATAAFAQVAKEAGGIK